MLAIMSLNNPPASSPFLLLVTLVGTQLLDFGVPSEIRSDGPFRGQNTLCHDPISESTAVCLSLYFQSTGGASNEQIYAKP